MEVEEESGVGSNCIGGPQGPYRRREAFFTSSWGRRSMGMMPISWCRGLVRVCLDAPAMCRMEAVRRPALAVGGMLALGRALADARRSTSYPSILRIARIVTSGFSIIQILPVRRWPSSAHAEEADGSWAVFTVSPDSLDS